jgi:fucose 4-O-acetylase-like acetyltransferase
MTGFFYVLKRSMVLKGLTFIPVYCLLVSMTAVAADIATAPEETFYLFRLAGAAMGGSVAVIFKMRRRGDITAAAAMFFVGLTTGFVSSRWVIDKLGWPNSGDYWLLASAIGGALGYMVLQVIYSRKFAEKIRGKLTNE